MALTMFFRDTRRYDFKYTHITLRGNEVMRMSKKGG
jgi:hypothetical protein